MAFKQANLTKVCNLLALNAATDKTPGLFHYATTDTFAACKVADYFDAIADQASVGSIIMVVNSGILHHLRVSANAAGVVTVADTRITASGQFTTVSASDNIDTGLGAALGGVVITEDSDPIDDPEWATASIGDQAGAPAAGHFLLKTWKNTAGNDPTPLAATTFGKKVNWFAWLA